jgi:hypothetical protein
VKKPIHQPQN